MADPQYGPRVTVTRSCADCKACKTESYACQGDSGIDWYCAHPTHEKRRYIGISSATPEWCPAPLGVDVPHPANRAARVDMDPAATRERHAEALRGLRSLKVLLGVDAPEVRGWAPAVQQAAQRAVNAAIRALAADGVAPSAGGQP